MPAAVVGASRGVAVVLHQVAGELFQLFVQVPWAVLAMVNPGREDRHDGDFDALGVRGGGDGRLRLLGQVTHGWSLKSSAGGTGGSETSSSKLQSSTKHQAPKRPRRASAVEIGA